MNTTNDRIIIGIDPGTNVMGYGVLRIVGNTPELMTLGVIQLNKFESHYLRLRRIFERVLGLIEQYLPDEMAIEAPFFGKNVQSMLKLGRAQGVAMAAALSRDIPITENGSASKEQVAAMLQRILHIPDENMPPLLDATDGLAAALCHFYQTNRPHLEKSYNSWKDFINKNPDKVSSGNKSDKK